MSSEVVITREIAPLPERADHAHKGDVGRILIIGGCFAESAMIGAPALTANAALRGGAGLVQLMVPEGIRTAVAVLSPCATIHSLPTDERGLISAVENFDPTVLAVGPGLGNSLPSNSLIALLHRFTGPMVIDADGLNLLASGPPIEIPDPHRIVMTPHPGEMRRLLAAGGRDRVLDRTPAVRKAAACDLAELYGCTVVLKGKGTIVTNGKRLYVNETGNSGMATGGSGDVLTGLVAALIGQKMIPFEAAILGVYLHGLAGDYAAEELGRRSLTAIDIIEFLPEAFGEHEIAEEDS